MTKRTGLPRPTKVQAAWLHRIAVSPLMVTRRPGMKDRYSLQNGAALDERIAEILIKNGWVVPERDGLPWHEVRSQTYRVRSVT